MSRLISISLLVIGFACSVYAQTDTDFEIFDIVVNPDKYQKTKVYDKYKNHISTKNELDISFSLAFLFYKNFISSQDGATCSFHPSCSEYGMLCVKEFGVIKGGIKTMDRLTRCNSLSPQKYTIDVEKRKLYDPIH